MADNWEAVIRQCWIILLYNFNVSGVKPRMALNWESIVQVHVQTCRRAEREQQQLKK